ncbi:lactate/malate family dehydrogenase [Candidatus Electrothrix sp.]|uniref:lactate/malate family dehydrogenase n=2 Tax=Candidatus Electrothrix sp. TaxID=2170559 RepID=UPI0040575963
MDITVIGAGGAVGRVLTQLIISEQLLDREQHLLLLGNPTGLSRRHLPGFSVDLLDAYAGLCPHIHVEFDSTAIRGDLIVMAAGKTFPADISHASSNRDMLAQENAPVFEHYASQLARYGHGHEIVICVSNPNELAVAIFAKHLGPKRVIGMGAFLDSQRFKKEIAISLGISRQRIHAFMLGEHGLNMVPLWSGVHIYGFTEEQLSEVFLKIRQQCPLDQLFSEVARVREKATGLISAGKISECYEMVSQYPPDIRAIIKPFITHFSGAKTAVGTAKATLKLLQAITMGHDTLIAGQVRTEGAFYGIDSTIGLPFIIGNKGVENIVELPIVEEEEEMLQQCAQHVNQKLQPFL